MKYVIGVGWLINGCIFAARIGKKGTDDLWFFLIGMMACFIVGMNNLVE